MNKIFMNAKEVQDFLEVDMETMVLVFKAP